MIPTIEQTTMRKVYWRVLPIAAASYFFCYLDRINVGFAALTMNQDRSFAGGPYALAAFALMAAVVAALWLHIPRRMAIPQAAVAA